MADMFADLKDRQQASTGAQPGKTFEDVMREEELLEKQRTLEE